MKKTNILNKSLALTVAALIGLGIFGVVKIKKIQNKYKNNLYVAAYYGDDSDENKVMKYIKTKELIEELNLDNYIIEDNNLYNSINSIKLDTPDNIIKLSNKFIKIINSKKINFKNIDKDFFSLAIYLKKQSTLIDNYLNEEGYEIVENALYNSLNKYTSEKYNLDINKSIYYKYADVFGNDVFIDYNNGEYEVEVNEKELNRGVRNLIKLNKDNDESYENALYDAAKLDDKVENTNLYNKKEEKIFKKKSK